MPKGSMRVRSGSITLRIGVPIATEGTTIRDRNRLLMASWDAIAELKQTATENAQGAQAQQVSSTQAATAINEVAHSAEDASGNARLAQEAA